MSEMLGNQYFMARNYSAALPELEECLIKNSDNRFVRKKLIVCYTQTGRVQKALDEFYKVIKDNINFIIDTDPVKEDCPCPELVSKLEEYSISNIESLDYNIMSGIIWLYCDASKSLHYFEKAALIEPENKRLTEIISMIEEYLKTNPEIMHT